MEQTIEETYVACQRLMDKSNELREEVMRVREEALRIRQETARIHQEAITIRKLIRHTVEETRQIRQAIETIDSLLVRGSVFVEPVLIRRFEADLRHSSD